MRPAGRTILSLTRSLNCSVPTVALKCVAVAICLALSRSVGASLCFEQGGRAMPLSSTRLCSFRGAFVSSLPTLRLASSADFCVARSGVLSRTCSETSMGRALARSRACPRKWSSVRLLVSSTGDKKRIVFLGTPEVAAESLQDIIEASNLPDSEFTVVAVVSNPPAKAGRKKMLTPSPVQALAEEAGLKVFTPTGLLKKYEDSAQFLTDMRDLAPDVCVTAAYGQFLPRSFLAIPKYGTLNIHPSLLPKFRGAAPVPRALEAGVEETGVSVLFTVFEMDAGPVLAQETIKLHGDEQAQSLLPLLFKKGSQLLLQVLPEVFSGKYAQDGTGCMIQNNALAVHAAKMSKEEGELWFTENAVYAHNKVRAFSGWPGTSAVFVLDSSGKEPQSVKVKIIKTKVTRSIGGSALGVHQIKMNANGDALVITCDDGSQLEILELQLPGKKVMQAKDFWNGMRGKDIERKRVGWSTGKVPDGQ